MSFTLVGGAIFVLAVLLLLYFMFIPSLDLYILVGVSVAAGGLLIGYFGSYVEELRSA